MGTIKEWLDKNVKEGANIAELEEMIANANPLRNVTDKASAEAFIKSNDIFKSAFDSSVTSAIKNYEDKHLPEKLKAHEEEIRKSLNPEETAEQKRIRELEEKISSQEKAEQRRSLEIDLRNKAKEYAEKKGLKYDVTRAERFAQFGDSAEQMLFDSIDYLESFSKDMMQGAIKGSYQGNQGPGAGNQGPMDLNSGIADAKQSGDLRTASKLYIDKVLNK